MTRTLPSSVQAVIGGESRRPSKAKPAIPPESEAHFQAVVIDLAKAFGWQVFHTYDSRRSQPGFPDLVLLRKTRGIAAELKVGRRKVTTEQARWLRAFAMATFETYIWYETDKQQIALVLQ